MKVLTFTVSGTGLAYAISRLPDGRTLSSIRGATTQQNRERNASAAVSVRGRGRVFEESASSSHANSLPSRCFYRQYSANAASPSTFITRLKL